VTWGQLAPLYHEVAARHVRDARDDHRAGVAADGVGDAFLESGLLHVAECVPGEGTLIAASTRPISEYV